MNAAWDQFTTDNGSPELVEKRARLNFLLAFIHDAETRPIHEIRLGCVRSREQIKGLPFRRDSPGLRWFMEMDMIARLDVHVLYRCRRLRTEARRPVALVSAWPQSDGELLRVCSWCKKVDLGHDYRAEIEAATRL